MKKKMNLVFSLALILSMFLASGCAAVSDAVINGEPIAVESGQLISIGKFQTMHMVNSALAGAWWSTILTDPTGTKFIIVWPMTGTGGVAFFVWDAGKVAAVSTMNELLRLSGMNRAQLGDIDDVSVLVSQLQNKGWSIVDAATISAAAKAGLMTVLKQLNRLDTFYILPVNPSDPYGLDDVEQSLCDPDGDGVSNCGLVDG